MKIYLVENDEGHVLACLAHKEDALLFALELNDRGKLCDIVERKLWYGQPSVCGFNE